MHRIDEEVEHRPRERELEVIVEGDDLDRYKELSRDESCEGAGYSPRISIGRLTAPYLAMIMDDQDYHGYNHWLIWNVPARSEIPRNIPKREVVDAPIAGVQGRNSFGEIGYTEACPPAGERHRYRLRVFGLDGPLDLGPGSTGRDLERALEGHILQYGEVTVHYDRGPPRPHSRP